ncbi:small hydrophilic protein [Streptomyces sp. NPDC049837]|uniref:small hydrophilic protein n=1 Tax=Streptomyces sp. NPDC049837 TaxID=3155277 RepID=UPI0034233C4F
MAFTHRMVTLAAVVAIPLGIAATSYTLTDTPEAPKVPPEVELGTSPRPSGSPEPSRTTPGPGRTASATPTGVPVPSTTRPPAPKDTPPARTLPTDTVVPGPPATAGDDDDDDLGDDIGDEN